MNTRTAVAITGASLAACAGLARAQAFTQNFDNITTLVPGGWFMQNSSDAPSNNAGWINGWFQGNPANFAAHSGATNSYIASNFHATVGTTGTETISVWLLTPAVVLHNGDTLTFWTRTNTSTASNFPDRLEVRLSTTGTGTNVGVGSAAVGDFTTLLLSVNPDLLHTGPGSYPAVWTQFTATVAGLSETPTGRFAFRYYVTNAGPNGSNSDYIGIDDAAYALAPVATGACCHTDATCADAVTQEACAAGGGVYQGDSTVCSAVICGSTSSCYANCDHSTATPFLNALDFSCFLQKFAAQDASANCDGSTTAPTLNALDFSCFLQKFAAGCSAP